MVQDPSSADPEKSSHRQPGPDGLNLPELANWAAGQRERLLIWLGSQVSQAGNKSWFNRQALMPVTDRLAGIGSGLLAMILVDRFYGPAGLGMYAWFFSLLAIAGYLGRYGIPVVVENDLARRPDATETIAAPALAALLALGGAAVGLCTFAAFYLQGPGPGVDDNLLVLLLGPTIFFQNINALRLAILNGHGRHADAARLKIRQRIIFLGVTFFLCVVGVPVALVAGGFLISQMIMAVMGRKRIRLPGLGAALAARQSVRTMLDRGRSFLFADNLLDVVFYLDMLILGWSVHPVQLGIYARALILARLFLVVPAALRPIFRRVANRLADPQTRTHLMGFMARSSRWIFFVHGLVAVLVLVYFPQVLTMLYHAHQWVAEAFAVFALVVPGLIFYASVTALEPVFEARHSQDELRRINVSVALVNLILNINLIPLAGIQGAGLATALSMVFHYFLFRRQLPADLRGFGFFWTGTAAALYLTYVFLEGMDIGVGAGLLLAPALFGTLLWMVGFFAPRKA